MGNLIILKTFNSVLALTLLATLGGINNTYAKDDNYAVVLKAKGHSKSVSLHLSNKKNKDSKRAFGSTIIPSQLSIKLLSLRRLDDFSLKLSFDGLDCFYEVRNHLINKSASLEYCENGYGAGDTVNVTEKIIYSHNSLPRLSVFNSDVRLSVSPQLSNVLHIPYLEAQAGQILKYDGEYWVPSDYLPDGTQEGNFLQWSGSQWVEAVPELLQGPQGLPGVKGDKGDKGDAGVAGAQGPQGLPGEKGDKGDKGDAGVAGAQGPQGLPGEQGPQGLPGVKGDKGDKGDAGVAGAQGPQGLPGEQGPQGLPGIQGAQGIQGEQGPAGTDANVQMVAGVGIVGSGSTLEATSTISVDVGTGAGQIPQLDSEGKLPSSVLPESEASGGGVKFAYLKDIKPSGVPGGSCTAGNWQVRDLTTVEGDSSIVSLNADNTFVLQAGTYQLDGQAPAYLLNRHQIVIRNEDTGANLLIGTSSFGNTSFGTLTYSYVTGQIVLTMPTRLSLRHRCATGMDTYGLGIPHSFDTPELYGMIKIVKSE